MSSDIGRDRYDDGGPLAGSRCLRGFGVLEPGPAPRDASAPPTQAMPAATPPAPAPTRATPVVGTEQQQTTAFYVGRPRTAWTRMQAAAVQAEQ